jgi:carbon-monoxide dehydrogenase medium subunit
MKNFNYSAPKNLNEVHDLLAKYPEKIILMAGGTDLMVQMRLKQVIPNHVIDLKGVGLSYIKPTDKGLTIGATTTLHEVETSRLIQERCTVLATTCSDMASYSIRHLGTIGGNLCNASPSADMARHYSAWCENQDKYPKGAAYSHRNHVQGPGETVLKPGDVLTEIRFLISRRRKKLSISNSKEIMEWIWPWWSSYLFIDGQFARRLSRSR